MSYSSEVLADSPLGYWRLDDTSGTTAVDSSGNSRNGTYNGGPTLSAASLLISDSDTAVDFDGSNDYVDISYAALELYSSWTLEAWIKPRSGSTRFCTVIAQQYDGSRVPFMLGSFDGTNHTMKPSAGFYNGSWHYAQSSSAITANTIHHIVGTWDGTDIKIYVDGSLAATTTPGTTVTQSTDFIRIASRWDNGGDVQKFDGVLDEVAIYSSALTSTRIAAHYTAGTASPNVTINAPMATATADAFIPFVNTPVLAPMSTATAAAFVPTISVGSSATVAAVMATATADALAPTLKVTLLPAIITANSLANIPVIGPLVVEPIATATAAALVPTVTVTRFVTVLATMATALAGIDQEVVVLINGYPGSGYVPGNQGAGGTYKGLGDFWTFELHNNL